MKQVVFYLTIAGIMFLCSCRNQPEASTTDFYQDFNLGSVVKKINLPEHQLREKTGSAGETITELRDYRRNFILIYEIEEQDGKRFDEERFFNEIKSEVAEKINETGVRINGEGSSDGSFTSDI